MIEKIKHRRRFLEAVARGSMGVAAAGDRAMIGEIGGVDHRLGASAGCIWPFLRLSGDHRTPPVAAGVDVVVATSESTTATPRLRR